MLLQEKDLIARGKQRSIYRFPNDEQLLVKIVVEKNKDNGHKQQAGFRGYLKHYLPYARYRHIFREVEHESIIQMRSILKGIRSPIAPTRGIVSSDKSLGLVVKQISQKDGTVGLTLFDLFHQGKFDEKALASLNEFAQSLFTLGVIGGDLHAKNIVWGDYHGELVPFIVDGYGDRNFIRLKTYLPWFRKQKMHKCFKHMAKQIGCEWLRSKKIFVFKNG